MLGCEELEWKFSDGGGVATRTFVWCNVSRYPGLTHRFQFVRCEVDSTSWRVKVSFAKGATIIGVIDSEPTR